MDAAIRTKTGATISAIVVRKKNVTGKQPATLFHHIYTDTAYNLREAKESALRGYVGVVSDPRGKRLSPDAPAPWEHDVEDTNAVIEWISKQPWSDGQVGMYGYSYMGFAQWAAAKNRHPALKTIVPAAASFPGNGLPMQNNVFLNANYAWPFHVMNNKFLDYPIFNDRARWNSMFQKWYESGRPYREIDQVEGPPNPLLRKQMLHPSYDAYWKAMQPYKEEFAKINIPVLTLTGYYDTANSAAVNYLVDHYTYNPRANHYLVIGPYSHGGVDDAVKNTVVNGYTIDPAAQINAVELTYQWFDYVMKGGPKPAMLKDRINYEAMGANEWRSAPSITAMSMKKKLYLSSTKAGERYTLTAAKPGAGSLEQTVDFADRKTSNNLSPQGAIETQIDFPTRLVFVSEPFEEAVSFDGMLSGELKATIDKRDFDFTIALYEQMPDGKYFNLSYYLGRASYADDMATRKLLKPGEARVLPFSRTPLMSRQMSKGSRLVLLVTVNKNAFSQVNYGTGKDVSDESIADAKEPLHVKWHTDSFVEVPLWVGGK
jgi:putative CocE/NonD family hydrolase